MHINVAASGREGVYGLIIENDELELALGQVAGLCNALADALHVILNGLVFIEAVETDDLFVIAPRLLDLALGGREDHVLLAGRGIGGAASHHEACERRGSSDDELSKHVLSPSRSARRPSDQTILYVRRIEGRVPGHRKRPLIGL
jgi:hypothetical protein